MSFALRQHTVGAHSGKQNAPTVRCGGAQLRAVHERMAYVRDKRKRDTTAHATREARQMASVMTGARCVARVRVFMHTVRGAEQASTAARPTREKVVCCAPASRTK